MKFYPPVESYSDKELVRIANSTTEYWQHEFIDDARKELANRGVSKEFEIATLTEWEKEIEQTKIEQTEWLNKNAAEEYDLRDKLIILVFAPLILLGKWQHGDSLSELKADNYKLKHLRRRTFLFLGVAVWIATLCILSL